MARDKNLRILTSVTQAVWQYSSRGRVESHFGLFNTYKRHARVNAVARLK